MFLSYKFGVFNIYLNSFLCFLFKFKFFVFKINITSTFFLLNNLKTIFSFFFVKRRRFFFVGKTYKFYKKKSKIRYYFNRSHKTILYFFKLISILKKKKKYKIFFFSSADFFFYINFIKRIRKLNIFTRRGIKTSKLFLFKKKGKISSYRLNLWLYKQLDYFYNIINFITDFYFLNLFDFFISSNIRIIFFKIYVFLYFLVLLYLFFSTISVKYINYNNMIYYYFILMYLFFILSIPVMHLSLSSSFHFFINFQFYKFFFSSEYSFFSLCFSSQSSLFSCVTIQIAFFVNIFSYYYNKFEVNKVLFFFLLNYFFISMLFLFNSKNFIFIFFFWECIGFFSFWLINFFFIKPTTFKSALKAFSFNKISDASLLASTIIYYNSVNSFSFSSFFLKNFSTNVFTINLFFFKVDSVLLFTIFICVACFIKSAQFIFHIWLPDSMEAPLPASALIHSATLVASGLYLFLIFKPLIQNKLFIDLLSVYFSFTFFFGSFSAFIQTDFKKILAYSTISNCAAVFLTILHLNNHSSYVYFSTHGWFKSLSFLILGYLTINGKHKQDLRVLVKKNFSVYINIAFSLITLTSLANWLVIQSSLVKHNLFYLNLSSVTSILFLVFGGVCSTLYSLKIISYIFFNFDNSKKSKQQQHLVLFYINLIFLIFIFFIFFFNFNLSYNVNYNYIVSIFFFLIITVFVFFKGFLLWFDTKINHSKYIWYYWCSYSKLFSYLSKKKKLRRWFW